MQRVLLYGRGAGRVRPDLAPGCPERFSGEFAEFVRYVCRYPRDRRPLRQQMIERQSRPLRVIRLGSARAVRAFLRQIPGTVGAGQ